MPLLSELIARAGLQGASVLGDVAVRITDITSDSREVRPGALFVAMSGTKADGAQYVPEAIRKGAAALLLADSARVDMAASVPVVRVGDVRAAISALAAAMYPSQPPTIFAVTGTDGKTSSADFTRQLAELSGYKAASIGTLGLRSPVAAVNEKFPAINTSPEPVLLHRTLSALCDAGVTHVAIEASSHGLDQKRLDGLKLTAAAFTNLTRDHLDYHGTVEEYARAKQRLFTDLLPEDGIAVLNRDDAQYDALAKICTARGITLVSFGTHKKADYRIDGITPHAQGFDATVSIHGKSHALKLPFYGAFQLSNMLTAAAMLSASGADIGKLLTLFAKLKGVPGRLEKVAERKGAPIFVDYAHTPAALQNILKVLRAHTSQKLHVVFGCGGDRDQGKRSEMGAVATQHADVVYVTDDNPRSEDPASIRAAILAAAKGAKEIPDRAAAIRAAMQQLSAGDVLVIAGKGHETTQTIGTQAIHFSDQEEIRKATA